MAETVHEKKLNDGNTLRMVRWTSDNVSPGSKFHQLELVDNIVTLQYPTSFEYFTEGFIRDLYNRIWSRTDLERIRDDPKSYRN